MKRTRITTLILAIFLIALAGPGCDSGGDGGGEPGGDSVEPGEDTTTEADGWFPGEDTIDPPPEDTIDPPPEDTIDPPPEDTIVPPPEDTIDPPPEDTIDPNGCGDGPPCGANEECCELVGQMTCVPAGQCGGGPGGCESNEDCPGDQVCCPGQIPGMPGACAADCGGAGQPCTTAADCPEGEQCCEGMIPGMGGTCDVECGGGLPSCASDDDCPAGLACQDLMGFASVCLDTCEDDAGCPGTCQPVGAMGFDLAKVCDCTECPADTQCCTIDLLGFITVDTCMGECIDLGGLLPF
jgi:hypothetical protein